MKNQDQANTSFQIIGEKEIPTKWVEVLRTGNFIITETPGCWAITSREGLNIVSFDSKNDMIKWKGYLILWKRDLKTKELPYESSNKQITTEKKKKKQKAVDIKRKMPKAVDLKSNFVITEAYKRMRNDTDYWREQS